ncbi:MAG: metallophosphoesterase [Candidatus Hadarchaeales archaeon]
MRIAATADIHSPLYLEQFKLSLEALDKVDLFLLAGDLVLKNQIQELERVLSAIRKVYQGPILSCFGNEEYEQDWEKYLAFGEMEWLEGRARVLETREGKVAIAGSKGSLDRPTFWQRRNVPGIWKTYAERVNVLDSILADIKAEIKIVLTHYSPTYRTLEGERESAWPEMACKKLERVIESRQPDVWIHGHAHRGKVPSLYIGKTLLLNVSFPARGSIVVFEVPRRTGLDLFLSTAPG